MTIAIGDIPGTVPDPQVEFFVYPTDTGPGTNSGPEFVYTVDGTTVSTGVFSIPYNHETTFTTVGYVFASGGFDPTSPPLGVPSIIEYFWDFGDGAFAYGPTVTHKFKAPNSHTRVTLRVRDSRGKTFFAGQQVNLIPSLLGSRNFSDSSTGADELDRLASYHRSTTDSSTPDDHLVFTYVTQFGAYENVIFV